MPIQIHNQIRFGDTSLGRDGRWSHLLETGRAGLNSKIITLLLDKCPAVCMISSQFHLWHTYYIVLLFLKGKKSSLMISAVINEGPQRPSSSRDNLVAGVQLSNRLKKNQRARGQQTNVAQDRQTPAPVQMAEKLQSSNQNPAWSESIILSAHCRWWTQPR